MNDQELFLALTKKEGSELFLELEFSKLYYIADGNYILAANTGYYSEDVVRPCFEGVLEGFKKFNCGKVLHFNYKNKGSITGVADYINKEWAPKAMEVGYIATGVVISMDVFAKFSINLFLSASNRKGVKRKMFDNLEEGYRWIEQL